MMMVLSIHVFTTEITFPTRKKVEIMQQQDMVNWGTLWLEAHSEGVWGITFSI